MLVWDDMSSPHCPKNIKISAVFSAYNKCYSKNKLAGLTDYVKCTSGENAPASACIGCGKCAKLCPLNNIMLKDGKPVWGDECTHCMACIGNCPTEAIEYGSITQKKEKYNFGKHRHVLNTLENKGKDRG